MTTRGGFAKFVFAKAGKQTLTLSGATYGGGGLPLEVGSGTTLTMGTSVLGGAGTFTLLPGSTLESGHANGLDSSLASTGAMKLSKAANYTFNGLAPQKTGVLLPDTVNNLTISDTLGVRLSSKTTVNGTLTLAAGKFSLGSKNLAQSRSAAYRLPVHCNRQRWNGNTVRSRRGPNTFSCRDCGCVLSALDHKFGNRRYLCGCRCAGFCGRDEERQRSCES